MTKADPKLGATLEAKLDTLEEKLDKCCKKDLKAEFNKMAIEAIMKKIKSIMLSMPSTSVPSPSPSPSPAPTTTTGNDDLGSEDLVSSF